MRGSEGMKSADRIIPAPLSPDLTARIQDMAVRGFKAIDGMVRPASTSWSSRRKTWST
jgi:hypothetical protein